MKILFYLALFLCGCKNYSQEKVITKDKISKKDEQFATVNETDLYSNILLKINEYGGSKKYVESAILARYLIDLPTKFDAYDYKLENIYDARISSAKKTKSLEIDKNKCLENASLELNVDLKSYMLYKKKKSKEVSNSLE